MSGTRGGGAGGAVAGLSGFWTVDASGHLIPAASNTYNFGSAGNAVRDIWCRGITGTGGFSTTGNITVGAAGGFLWTGRSGFYAPATGQVQFLNSAETQPAALIHGMLSVAKTAAYTVVGKDDSGKLFTNEGATTSVPFSLPTAVAGLFFGFHVQDADGLSIIAAAGDTLQIGTGAPTAAAGSISSTTVGSRIWLHAINATEWVTDRATGTWA